jgi:hypothetical protein
MIDLVPVLLLVALAALAWFAWDSLRARETANRTMREACEARGWLFLDDTVALRRLRPGRDDAGRMTLRRTFDFAYSGTGFDRRSGRLVLLGPDVEALDLSEVLPPVADVIRPDFGRSARR